MKFEKGRHGPKPVTGKFASREKLESEVARMMEGGISQNKIAIACDVACATINNIVKMQRKRSQARDMSLKRAVLCGAWGPATKQVVR